MSTRTTRYDELLSTTVAVVHAQRRTPVTALTAAAERAGYVVHVLPSRRSDTKPELLSALAEALAFPDWFGHNWDALADCLSELVGRHCLIWRGAWRMAAIDPEAAATLAAIVTEVGASDPGRLLLIALDR